MRNGAKEQITAPKKECKVCEKAESRYKCPICLIPYCSLICFKKHKEIPCAKPAPAPENDTGATITTVDVDRPCYVDAADKVLQRSQLECIASNSEIIDALKDKELKNLIRKIDSSADAETALDKAMGEEAFRLFTEKILSTLNQSSNQQS
ncbi:hypothetical protein L1987_22016 [Smallanthus sonchifolius]|uniref:Uncharacterized protein n=1 Tax=Smallanthus sonchifolius TaxID=185202 RepID=A0ACB9ICZ7_9ASTR|nr:hypothetical protein L1987_22016 [Smallanthus sonchifolius]